MRVYVFMGFPGGSEVKASTWNGGDLGSISGLGKCPGEGKGYLLQYSGLENSMDLYGSEVKASAWNAGDLGSIPGLGRSPGEGNGTLLQYSCLENPMEGGAWSATVHGVAKSRTRLSDCTLLYFYFIAG